MIHRYNIFYIDMLYNIHLYITFMMYRSDKGGGAVGQGGGGGGGGGGRGIRRLRLNLLPQACHPVWGVASVILPSGENNSAIYHTQIITCSMLFITYSSYIT